MRKSKHPSKRIRANEHMTHQEIKVFMNLHGLSKKELAEILGVTPKAVEFWVSGQRCITITNSRLMRLFDVYPQLLKEF